MTLQIRITVPLSNPVYAAGLLQLKVLPPVEKAVVCQGPLSDVLHSMFGDTSSPRAYIVALGTSLVSDIFDAVALTGNNRSCGGASTDDWLLQGT